METLSDTYMLAILSSIFLAEGLTTNLANSTKPLWNISPLYRAILQSFSIGADMKFKYKANADEIEISIIEDVVSGEVETLTLKVVDAMQLREILNWFYDAINMGNLR